MNHVLITMWKTLDGTFYANSATYANYDDGVGAYHNKFKPMQNDLNVSTFTLYLIDENAAKVEKCSWIRTIAETENSELSE